MISNWGNYPKVDAAIFSPSYVEDFKQLLVKPNRFICRGNGRSYGDVSLNNDIISMLDYAKFIKFDPNTGLLSCQAGLLLSEILDIIVPKGFFLPVTPGTKFITIGGAVAANVHGKNHHVDGSISRHVTSLKILRGDGETVNCSPDENSGLFWETFGAMGMTGIILEVEIRLRKIETSYIKVESIKAGNLDEVMRLFEESQEWTYSVAWIDCLSKGDNLGRSVMIRGEHMLKDEYHRSGNCLSIGKKSNINVPFFFPGFVLNSFTVKAFNFLFYHKQLKKSAKLIQHFDGFFYPLDAIHQWNRIYGKKGFTQFQCAIPQEYSAQGIKELLECINTEGKGSFLSVLKKFGKSDPDAVNSFPFEGYTLALDFKIDKHIHSLLKALDDIVKKYKGRIYLAKDAFCSDFDLVRYSNNSVNYFDKKFDSIQARRINDLQQKGTTGK